MKQCMYMAAVSGHGSYRCTDMMIFTDIPIYTPCILNVKTDKTQPIQYNQQVTVAL